DLAESELLGTRRQVHGDRGFRVQDELVRRRRRADSDHVRMASMNEDLKHPGYHQLPFTLQSATPRQPVDRSEWVRCEQCGRDTPSERTVILDPDGPAQHLLTGTYVCAHCRHSRVGTPSNHPDLIAQTKCHECETPLGGAYQCPTCNFPRGWKT